ncbi:MAG: hypothetical protein LUF91_08190 [Oscillospiraceae bacterium]|nr:hypothetical protein [Oscillospiraceae bacterium]
MLLTIVMVFGTVGTTVSAQYGGSVTHTNPVSPGSGDYSGAFYVSLTQAGTGVDEGVRYSLVKVDKDAVATQITSFDQYETLGVYDAISSELDSLLSNRSAYTKLYFTNMRYGTYTGFVQRLNALDYEVGVGQYGSEFLTTVNMLP